MLIRTAYLSVEITRMAQDRLRVVFSRSDRPAQQVKEHLFDPAEAERVAKDLAAHMEDNPPGVKMADSLWLPSRDGAAPSVVVAACCRAGGLTNAGRELAGRFLRSGTRQVVAPFAAVSDRLAETFSCELYRRLSEGRGLAESVLEARRLLGTAGLAFIHYGTIPELSNRTETPRSKSWKKRFAVAASAAVIAAILAAYGLYWRFSGGAPQALEEHTANAAPVSSVQEKREPEKAAEPAGNRRGLPPENNSDRQPSAEGSAPGSDSSIPSPSRSSGRTGQPRVSEKLLDNF